MGFFDKIGKNIVCGLALGVIGILRGALEVVQGIFSLITQAWMWLINIILEIAENFNVVGASTDICAGVGRAEIDLAVSIKFFKKYYTFKFNLDLSSPSSAVKTIGNTLLNLIKEGASGSDNPPPPYTFKPVELNGDLCGSKITSSPTAPPTDEPTGAPTKAPTYSPTSAPTEYVPKALPKKVPLVVSQRA
jgi:hypothetical protein